MPAVLDLLNFDVDVPERHCPTVSRREALRAMALGLGFGGIEAGGCPSEHAAILQQDACHDDIAIDPATALIFPSQAPLVPAAGLRDARAVWCRVPAGADRGVLIYLHGHNGYVTVDRSGHSRVPDWAAADRAAAAGASSKNAAPLVYQLDRLESKNTGTRPIVLVPEVSTLATGSFWAKEPAGQYADPARLGLLVDDCLEHLACLSRPDGPAYLASKFTARKAAASSTAHINAPPGLDRVYLCGHSGAGLPLEEAAKSALILPETGVPSDLWLFDSTYWSKVVGFVEFCERWKRAGRLAGSQSNAARFVCIYRPKTQTEEVADALRNEIARGIGASADSLVKDHTADNFRAEIAPALKQSGVLFVRTYLQHDDIPTFFIPALLETASK